MNHLLHMLKAWHQSRDSHQWVLATISGTDGSAYRKSGAMMLVNDMGQQLGLLSGGCLEADIVRQARKCLLSGAK